MYSPTSPLRKTSRQHPKSRTMSRTMSRNNLSSRVKQEQKQSRRSHTQQSRKRRNLPEILKAIEQIP